MTLPDWTCVLSRFSCVCLFVTPWTSSCQAPQSMGFSRQEYWSGLPFPPPGNLPDPGIEPTSLMSPVWQSGSLPLAPPGSPWQGWKWESSFLIHLCCAQLLSPIHLSATSCIPPGSCVRGILQGRILEQVAVCFSRRYSQPRDQTQVSHIVGRFFTV